MTQLAELDASPTNAATDVPPEFWESVEIHRAELISQALRITGNTQDAEDVVQETFCEAFRQGVKVAADGLLGARLGQINRCNALNRVRSNRRDSKRIDLKQQTMPDSMFTTGGFSYVELKDTVDRVLKELPANLRSVIEMRFYRHYSYKQIAHELKIPIGTVGTILTGATVQLYSQLRSHLESGPRKGPA